jgi:hypothetical protein
MRDSASARALVLERPCRLVLHDIPLPSVGEDARSSRGGLRAGLHETEDLLATMASEREDVPPVHGVVTS